MKDLKDKVALINGASSDVGKVLCEMLLSEGVRIAGTYNSNPAPIEELAKRFNKDRLISFRLNFLDPDLDIKIEETVKEVVKILKRIDFLISASGVWLVKPLLYERKEEIEKVWRINYWGPYFFMQKVIPYMINEGGCIVNIASSVGVKGGGQQASYGASKAALINLSKSVAEELAPRKIRVVSVSPGFIDTKVLDKYFDEPLKELAIKHIPLARFASSYDIAHTIMFCLTNPYITGANIVSEGGVL
jgi:3-oxoacyl-[acyl-carrier protein] reductase